MEDWLLYVYFRETGTIDFPLYVQFPKCRWTKSMVEAATDGGLKALCGRYVDRWRVRLLQRLTHNDSYAIYGQGADGSDCFHVYVQTPRSTVSRQLVKAMVKTGLHRYLGNTCKKITARKQMETHPGSYEGLLYKVS
jgi:hypothetical protein